MEPKNAPKAYTRSAYAQGEDQPPIDLLLDANEGAAPDATLLSTLSEETMALVRRYPNASGLEAKLAARYGVQPAQVLVTAGADDALDRYCRAFLGPERPLFLPWPSFVMLQRYALAQGAKLIKPMWWQGPYPREEALEAAEQGAAIAIVSPNNPTGAVASEADVRALGEHAPLLVDLAYAEFAQTPLFSVALQQPRAIVFGTFSKAWGLAGLRVGYAIGPEDLIARLRATGLPYPVGGLSLLLAERALTRGLPKARVERVIEERKLLTELLRTLRLNPYPSEGNFVFARPERELAQPLAAAGIAIRSWPDDAVLSPYVRITCPGDQEDFERLTAALKEACR